MKTEVKAPQTIEEISTPEALLFLGLQSAEINGELQLLDGSATMPSAEEILAAKAAVLEQYQITEYKRQRALAYPSIAEQLDTLYHQGYEGWRATIDEIKNQFPKPTV